jgi:3-hydroxyacyl-[acyl-carrier-protein] dehydratase
MRFSLIDRIENLEPGVKITALKALSMAEEYLADHFPRFPVMPGVLMLEAMTQAGAWLVRASEDFAHSMVVLKEAKGVKYGQFVEPGQTLRVTAEILSQTDRETVLKARGVVDGRVTVNGRLVLERYDLSETRPEQAQTDTLVKKEMRALFALLYQPNGRRAKSLPEEE